MFLSEIPGLTRACQRADRLEDYWRDFAFLGLTYTLRIAGGYSVEVKLLTLRMFIQLCAVRSPFMVGGRIGPEHVAQFLWRVSPSYGKPELRKEFVASIAPFPFRPAVRAINRFVDRMLIDRPPQPARSNDAKGDTSFAAGMIHALAKEYGWSADAILDQPMSALFQYYRRIQRAYDPDCSYWNPIRDRLCKKITDKFLARKNGN